MGNLAETPLAPLLLSLARDQFEGWLTLERPGLARRFRWKKGAPVQLASERAEDGVAALLTARGQLSAPQLAALPKKLEEKAGNEVAALAALGVAPKELLLGLAGSLERALADCLRWTNGTFTLAFEPAPGNAPILPLSLPALVFEAISASWRADQVLVALGERATRFPAPVPDAEAKIGAKLWQQSALKAVLAQLDGARSAFEALREAHHPHAHAALWLLDACGALSYQDARAGGSVEDAPRASGPEIEVVVAGRDAAVSAAAAAAATAQQAQPDPAREAAAAALREEVTALHAQLGELDLWQVLGVARGASAGDVKRAYLKAAKRLHPDHLMRLGLHDLKEVANEVFTQIARAHEVLSDPDERARYEESTVGVSETEALLAAQAEQLYQRGEMLMRAGNFRGAAEFLEKAVQTYGAEPDYHAALAWALHRRTPPDNARALEHFERALAGGEKAQLLLRMSAVLREQREDARAAQLAARAKALDPNVRL
ncbi:MAG TPA: DnaJ domain-containing protein [Myxococcota bacterium]|nr:DnaJ domain-containing protein [Myxococcota bacterium]